MKNQKNHIKKISIINKNNNEKKSGNNNLYKDRSNQIKELNKNRRINNLSYNTINDVNRISRRIHIQKINNNIPNEKIEKVNTSNMDKNIIYKREINQNKNQYNKIHLTRNSDIQLSQSNYFKSNSNNNSFMIKNDLYKNNYTFHFINERKKMIQTETSRKEKNKIYKNHSTIFISGLSKREKNKTEKNSIVKNILRLNTTRVNHINKENFHIQKERKYQPLLLKNKSEEKKDLSNNNKNIGKEDNKVEFSRRLEITEKTEVLLPNQIFKPFEQFEKKEKPIIEIKENKDGTNTIVFKEILVKTKIENSIIAVPKINLINNAPKVNLIKQKITKEYITTIKFYSNLINIINENSNINNNKTDIQKRKTYPNYEIKQDKIIINENNCRNNLRISISNKSGDNIINHEKDFNSNTINNEFNSEREKNDLQKNNLFKNAIPNNKINIKNTVYSNVINNNINKPHKKNNISTNNTNMKKSKINHIISKSIQNKNFNTIDNESRKHNYSTFNGNNRINLNIDENKDEYSFDAINNDSNKLENSNYNNSEDKLKSLKSKDFNFYNNQMMSNQSQILSNINNVNGSLNSFSMSEGKASNKALFDVVFNSDFEKIDFDKLNEIKNDEKDNNLNKEKEKNDEKKINTKETKYDKLNEFIIQFNDEINKPNLNNNIRKENNNNSHISDKLYEEKKLNQMQVSNINLSLKDCEENENDDNNNAYNVENTNNFDNRNLTGSIMFINSNIDNNIHIQNGLENYNINEGNSISDNFNITEGKGPSQNNNQNIIDNIESVKKSMNYQQKNNNTKSNNNDEYDNIIGDNNYIDEKEEKEIYEIDNDEKKFFHPLNKYKNKFNLDQINPF